MPDTTTPANQREVFAATLLLLYARREAVEQELDEIESLIGGLEKVQSRMEPPQITLTDVLTPPPSTNGTAYKGKSQGEATRMYLTEKGASLVPDIARGLLAGGIASSNPKNLRTNLHTLLGRAEWAEKLADGRWQVKPGY